MIIDHRIERNSGSVLEPCIHKVGNGAKQQGMKMQMYGAVFAPVTLTQDDGYIMPVLAEPVERDLVSALERLTTLWSAKHVGAGQLTDRTTHHLQQVKPYADAHPILYSALAHWYHKTAGIKGRSVTVVHGDPTMENYMADGVWLDPSIRPMPLEAELDGGKLLQSYFGYGQPCQFYQRKVIRNFLCISGLSMDLCLYYMVTHVVRLYRIQTHARSWALDLLSNLTDEHELVKELQCK